MGNDNMSVETGASVLLTKFGLVKLLGLGSALIGAGIMTIFRPPKSRREMFMQGAVALGSSLLFGGTAVKVIAHTTGWIDLNTADLGDMANFVAAVYGLIGAFSWGLFGGFAVLRDKFSSDPVQTIKDVKSL